MLNIGFELDLSSSLHFPEFIASPKFDLGSKCRWKPLQYSDWGTLIGQVYAPRKNGAEFTSQWSWLYLLLLDSDSPSRNWVSSDWVWEDDLEPFVEQGCQISPNIEEKD